MYLQNTTTPMLSQSKSDEFFDFPHPPSSLLQSAADFVPRELQAICKLYQQRIVQAFREAASVPEPNQYIVLRQAFKGFSAEISELANLMEEALHYKRGLIARMEAKGHDA
jgi:hypothetical protein